MVQTEEDAYPMYSPYVDTEAVSAEELPAVEDDAGPSWFFVVCSGVETASLLLDPHGSPLPFKLQLYPLFPAYKQTITCLSLCVFCLILRAQQY